MENQKHIYSDLHEFSPPVMTRGDSLALYSLKPNENIVFYHHDILLLWIK